MPSQRHCNDILMLSSLVSQCTKPDHVSQTNKGSDHDDIERHFINTIKQRWHHGSDIGTELEKKEECDVDAERP